MPKPGHGLRHKLGGDLWACTAELVPGTFTDLLTTLGVDWSSGQTISLSDCLSRIPEVAAIYSAPSRGKPNVSPVRVRGHHSGKLSLEFDERLVDVQEFRAEWALRHPSLRPYFELNDKGAILNLLDTSRAETYEAACELCSELLTNSLMFSQSATWYAEREDNTSLLVPGIAKYLAAMFILGSLVRYEPDLLADAALPASETGWFLDRFIRAADRFFPQLALSFAYKNPVYVRRPV